MKYISTRGQSPELSFCDVLLEGLALDGGLYLPKSYPKFLDADLSYMRPMSYQDLTFFIFQKFVDDIPADDLKRIIDETYKPEVFGYSRPDQNSEEITPTLKLEDNLYLLSLSNGPTLAFKDIAMQFLGYLFEYVLDKKGRKLNILGATSGDTGSSAEYAMKGKKGINVFMLSPYKKMSAFQSAQMFSLKDSNIFNIAIEGVFDDCQDLVKAVSNDLQFKKENNVGAVNSINWGRILAQVIYYFKGYFSVTQTNKTFVDFTVPTGNFGNICAGHIARMMGLPIRHLVVATNENDVLDEFFHTGLYRPRKYENTFHTSSPSMDISKASNFERFIFDLIGRDASALSDYWKKLDQGGSFDLEEHLFNKIKDFGFVSSSSKHSNRIELIKVFYDKYGVIIDTHTADGVKAALDHANKDVPMLILETALPVKFEESILESIGKKPERPDNLIDIELLDQQFDILENNLESIKSFILAKK